MNDCPCGSNKKYITCCEPYISGKEHAPNPEALMRSRYTAYSQANGEYIARTMLPPANKGFDIEEANQWARQVKWLKLKVIRSSHNDKKGFVEFRVHYEDQGTKKIMHELSEFHLIEGRWYYVMGKTFQK